MDLWWLQLSHGISNLMMAVQGHNVTWSAVPPPPLKQPGTSTHLSSHPLQVNNVTTHTNKHGKILQIIDDLLHHFHLALSGGHSLHHPGPAVWGHPLGPGHASQLWQVARQRGVGGRSRVSVSLALAADAGHLALATHTIHCLTCTPQVDGH